MKKQKNPRDFSESNAKSLEKQIIESNKEEKGELLYCPVCGSTNLKPIIYGFSKDSAAISPEMKCTDCGFKGFMLSAKPDSLVKIRKNLKK
ncbi:MAG: hypothetical protein PHD95_05290 [Candidatus ainarchaeum sp.]|nr:hypothetical protein [Candidatus ainarchaeum sp.]